MRMTREEFWELIARTLNARFDMEVADERLQREFKDRTPAEILAFVRVVEQLVQRAYRWDLWAASDLIVGGVSPYSFRFFALYLIANGRNRYESAIRSADSLAEWAELYDGDDEPLTSVAAEVYERTTGDAKAVAALARSFPPEPAGEPCRQKQYYLRLPQLTHRWAPNLFPRPTVKSRCPQCGKKLRSNLAQQCLDCGADWHP